MLTTGIFFSGSVIFHFIQQLMDGEKEPAYQTFIVYTK